MMQMGTYIMTIFGLVFLFYTQGVLIKGRKKEFGLYSILGMNKGNIGKILFFETLITWAIAVVFGLAAGIGLSKLAEMGFTKMIEIPTRYTFSVSVTSVIMTVIVFTVIFFLIYLNSVRQVQFTNPIELVRADKAGEKPPKANWLFHRAQDPATHVGAHVVLCGGHPDHHRHLPCSDRGIRHSLQSPAEEPELLLQNESFRICFLHDIQNETKRSRTGVDLYSSDDDPGDAFIHIGSVRRI